MPATRPRWRPGLAFILLAATLILGLAVIVLNRLPRHVALDARDEIVFENDAVQVLYSGEADRLAGAFFNKGRLYATEDHFLFEEDPEGGRFVQLGGIRKFEPDLADSARDFIARLRLTRKLRRFFGANNLVVLESGTILNIYTEVHRSADGGRSFHVVFDLQGNDVELPFLHGISVDSGDNVYFGEYHTGQRPFQVKVMQGRNDGRDWSVFHEFGLGEIFHVHSVRYDPYRHKLWLCTGDTDEESMLLYFEDGDPRPQLLGGGDQGWRIVSLMPTENYLYWCSDDDVEGARVYRYDFERELREEVQFIGKPCYDTTRLADGTLVFNAVYEPGTVYSESARPRPTGEIWISRTGEEFIKIFELEVSRAESGMRPRILFPAGSEGGSQLYFTPRQTREDEFTLQQFSIRWKRN